MRAGWPSVTDVDRISVMSGDYLVEAAHSFRVRHAAHGKGRKKDGKPLPVCKPTDGIIYVAKQYPYWQRVIMDKLAAEFAEHKAIDNKRMAAELGKIPDLKKYQKRVMPFVQKIKERIVGVGAEQGLKTCVDFDEYDVLIQNLEYLKSTLDLKTLKIIPADEAEDAYREECCPGSPMISFTSPEEELQNQQSKTKDTKK